MSAAFAFLFLPSCRSELIRVHDTGCSAANACADTPLSALMGTGQIAYEPLDAGTDLFIVRGSQGGWHIWTGGRISATSPSISWVPKVIVHNTAEQIGGAQPPTVQVLGNWDGCTGEFFGGFAYIDDVVVPDFDAFVCDISGETLDLSLTVTDLLTGETTTDYRTANARFDEVTFETYCR